MLTSWKDKVSKPPVSPIGMPLKFVAPTIENGKTIVSIESMDIDSLTKNWESAVVMYVVGGVTSVEIIRGFIRKHWSNVPIPSIHAHEEGFFILRFNSDSDVSEILNGGPYFLNRAPVVVKKWSAGFDFKAEILRVIPVWIRLPSLPLHLWGVEALSKIVSAIGVPVLADECTMNQRRVSYARVLVEVDITRDFVTEINVRDSTGRSFTQKAIPEWRPYFCRKCNKVGHDCRNNKDQQQNQGEQPGKSEKENDPKKLWVPRPIVQMIKGALTIQDLRCKLAVEATHEDTNFDTQNDPLSNPNKENASNTSTQEDDNEKGWTPVAPGKVARRKDPTNQKGIAHIEQGDTGNGDMADHVEDETINSSTLERGGNPQISSFQ